MKNDLTYWWQHRYGNNNGLPRPTVFPGHVGLWLDRGLPWLIKSSSNDKPERRNLYETAEGALAPGSPARRTYRECLERLLKRTQPGPLRRVFRLTAQSRILLHTATSASVTEGAILLHHTYGVPYIPGSALKGVLRASLRAASADVHAFWFGQGGGDDQSDDQGGAFDVLDALWWPDEKADSPLALDVINPHHAAYYTNGAQPRESDDPQPTHRLSLRPGVTFRAILEFPIGLGVVNIDSLCARFERAVAEVGIGAWTTSGYGRVEAAAVLS